MFLACLGIASEQSETRRRKGGCGGAGEVAGGDLEVVDSEPPHGSSPFGRVPNVAPKHCRPTLFLSDFLVLILPVLSLWTRVCSNGYFLFWIKYLLLAAIAVMVVCLCAFDSNPFADPRMQFEFFVDFVSCIVSCVFIHGVMCCVNIIVRSGEIREMLLYGYVTRKRTNFTYRKVTAAVLTCFYLWLFFHYSRSFH